MICQDFLLLGHLLIRTRITVLPTGLEKTAPAHISHTILDARFQFLNWSSEIHVMGLTKIGNNGLLYIFGKVTDLCPGEPRGTLSL